jgi:HAD superfamily phosphoserine phosphatase-like hydrolase
MFYYFRHQWMNLSVYDLHHKIFFILFQGRDSFDMEEHVERFLNEELNQLLYDPVIQRLQAAKEQGHYTVILSASPDFLVRSIASRLNVHDYQASLYTINRRGCYDGISSILEGEKKAAYVKELEKRLDIQESFITVYSDSYIDLPVLKMAQWPVGVKPDRDLRKICLQKGWEILE